VSIEIEGKAKHQQFHFHATKTIPLPTVEQRLTDIRPNVFPQDFYRHYFS